MTEAATEKPCKCGGKRRPGQNNCRPCNLEANRRYRLRCALAEKEIETKVKEKAA